MLLQSLKVPLFRPSDNLFYTPLTSVRNLFSGFSQFLRRMTPTVMISWGLARSNTEFPSIWMPV